MFQYHIGDITIFLNRVVAHNKMLWGVDNMAFWELYFMSPAYVTWKAHAESQGKKVQAIKSLREWFSNVHKETLPLKEAKELVESWASLPRDVRVAINLAAAEHAGTINGLLNTAMSRVAISQNTGEARYPLDENSYISVTTDADGGRSVVVVTAVHYGVFPPDEDIIPTVLKAQQDYQTR